MSKLDKIIEAGKAKGIEALELFYDRTKSISFNLFRSEIEGYGISEGISLSARGIYKGKIGYANTERIDNESIEFLLDEIITNSKVVSDDDPSIIFKGSEKYKKRKVYNPELPALSIDKKKANLFAIEKKLKAFDPRIKEISDLSYSEEESELVMLNSYGLKLKSKRNYYSYYASVLAEEKGSKKSGYDFFLSNDVHAFNLDKFVNKVATEALSKLGAEPCQSGDYPTVLAPKVVSSLLGAYLDSASAEEIQKKSSLFIGKLNQPVASKKVTVSEMPLQKNLFFSYFDDEGVAKYNKTVIKKGVLQLYFHNLVTAKKENANTTANAARGSGKVGVGFSNIVLKPGRKSQEELFQKAGNGVFITEVQGLHAGLNERSGNFSLQCSGFMIENGKKTKPIALITVAGNLQEMFLNVKEVGSDAELLMSSFTVPSILVKKLSISGK